VKLEHQRRGDLSLVLTSPAGTKSNILSRRTLDDSTDGIDFTFMTVHNWGEDPRGVWTLSIEDSPKSGDTTSSTNRGRLLSWSVILYGIVGDIRNHKIPEPAGSSLIPHRKVDGSDLAREVDSNEVKHLMAIEEESSDSVKIESNKRLMKKDQEDREYQALGEALNAEDVEFLRRLFETEEEFIENSKGETNRAYQVRDTARKGIPTEVERRRFVSNIHKRAGVDADIDLADFYKEDGGIDRDTAKEIIDFVDNY